MFCYPKAAKPWAQPLDPSDRQLYRANFGAGAEDPDATPLLDLADGETIDTFDVVVPDDWAKYGLEIGTGEYAPAKSADGTAILVWLSVAEAARANEAFCCSGIRIPVVFTIVTTSSPPRTLQRTALIRVQQQ